ncbi:MAG: HipA N-terminal domain-containing protein [Legionella sp.]|jgi:serine/threonine-protein kinase HipA
MRKARILVNGIEAGILEELPGNKYVFTYYEAYSGAPVSLTMPIIKKIYNFDHFPSFFEGVLPEGIMLEGLLRKHKLDKSDFFGQLIQVGHDLVGAVTVEALP